MSEDILLYNSSTTADPEPAPDAGNNTPIEPQPTGVAPNATPPEPIEPPSNQQTNLLNAEPPAEPIEPPAEPEPIEINEETVNAYSEEIGLNNIPEFELGEDVYGESHKMSRDEMKLLVPAMMQLGIAKEKATETLSLIAAYQKLQLERTTTEARNAINQRITESKQKFGENLDRVCADAKKGALAIFDKSLWNEMCETPILINDARFIEALARVGRMVKTDTGTKASSTGDALGGQWSADHWIKSSAKYGTK